MVPRQRDAEAGKVRAMQPARKHIPDTPPRVPGLPSSVGEIVRRNRLALNQPSGGALLYKPTPKESI